jgi:hypothetical protein
MSRMQQDQVWKLVQLRRTVLHAWSLFWATMPVSDPNMRRLRLETDHDARDNGRHRHRPRVRQRRGEGGGMNEDLCNECESACRTCEAQQRDNARLRAWVRRWRNGCNSHGLIVATVSEFDDALAGKAPPRQARKASK